MSQLITVLNKLHQSLKHIKGKKYKTPLREATVHNTYDGIWGLRKGKWLYINKSSGEHSKMPDSFKELRGYKDFDTPALLFDMNKDVEQRNNIFEAHPEVIVEMASLLKTYKDQGYSVKR